MKTIFIILAMVCFVLFAVVTIMHDDYTALTFGSCAVLLLCCYFNIKIM